MKFRTLLALLIVLIGCAGNQQAPKSGLQIDNGINRGTSYTNSLGTDFNLRYIPITITNDTTTTIHFEIAFLKEYKYPIEYSDQKFRILFLPEAFTLDGLTLTTDKEILTDSMQNEFRNYMEDGLDTPYILNETLEPGEKCVLTIGTRYPNPAKFSGVLPNTLFVHSDGGIFPTCDWFMKENPSSNPQTALALRLNFGQVCMIIPCGQISYPED